MSSPTARTLNGDGLLCEVIVTGEPVPKGRPRVTRRGITYTPKKTVQYEKAIAWMAQQEWKQAPLDGPLSVTLQFGRRTMRGDLDNLVKSALDGLNGIVYKNDSQVQEIRATQSRRTIFAPYTVIRVYRFPRPSGKVQAFESVGPISEEVYPCDQE